MVMGTGDGPAETDDGFGLQKTWRQVSCNCLTLWFPDEGWAL